MGLGQVERPSRCGRRCRDMAIDPARHVDTRQGGRSSSKRRRLRYGPWLDARVPPTISLETVLMSARIRRCRPFVRPCGAWVSVGQTEREQSVGGKGNNAKRGPSDKESNDYQLDRRLGQDTEKDCGTRPTSAPRATT